MKNIASYLNHLFFSKQNKLSAKELSVALALIWFANLFSFIAYGANSISQLLYQQQAFPMPAISVTTPLIGMIIGGIGIPWSLMTLSASIGLSIKMLRNRMPLVVAITIGFILYGTLRSIFILPLLFAGFGDLIMGSSDLAESVDNSLASLKWILSGLLPVSVLAILLFYKFTEHKTSRNISNKNGLNREDFTLAVLKLNWSSIALSVLFLGITHYVLKDDFSNIPLLMIEGITSLVVIIISIILLILRVRNSPVGYKWFLWLLLIPLFAGSGAAIIFLLPHLLLLQLGIRLIGISMMLPSIFLFSLMIIPPKEDPDLHRDGSPREKIVRYSS